jgi:hypothetical protein
LRQRGKGLSSEQAHDCRGSGWNALARRAMVHAAFIGARAKLHPIKVRQRGRETESITLESCLSVGGDVGSARHGRHADPVMA